jgi:DNA transformation protein and related proteins
MSRPIAELRNLGPRMAQRLAAIDVHNENSLRELGAIEAWHRLRFVHGRGITIIALYALEGALRDCDWRRLPDEVKAALAAERRISSRTAER